MENRGVEKPDDLEIASLGSLYVGPWDKKYWSCSRGKDRYPYPVGYHAVRIHAGNICQMKVCEGLKGPLFVITAVDGSSFSGQTPDIAWENFQKNCPRVKNWNGRRSSNKIDGAEFFGLKNPSIQRLLRELVNTTQRRSLSSPFLYNGSKSTDQIHPQVSDKYSRLAFSLEENHNFGKRIQKRNARDDIMKEARPKKIGHWGLQSDLKTCILQQIDDLCSLSLDGKITQFSRKHFVSRNEDSGNEGIANYRTSPNDTFSRIMDQKPYDFQCQKETKIFSFANGNDNEETDIIMQRQPEANCHSVLASENIFMGLDCSDSVVDKHIVSEQNNCIDAKTCRFTAGLNSINNAIKITLDRCPDGVNGRNNPTLSVPNADCEEAVTLASFSDAFISDICDTVIGKNCSGFDVSDVAISALDHLNKIPTCMKNEIVAVKPLSRASESHSLEVLSKSEVKDLTCRSVPCGSEARFLIPEAVFHSGCNLEDGIYQGVAKDSLPEIGSSGSPGRSFEDDDLNLAGQELAKSMMTFLLPQAVPLLKKTYVRRRSSVKRLEANDPCCTLNDGNSVDPNTVNDHLNNIKHQGKPVAGTVTQLPEKTIKKAIDASKTLSQVCMSGDFNSFNLHLEPFSGNRSSNDPNSVIPDSFENDINSYSASMDEQSCMGFDESETAPHNDAKGNSLLITDVDEVDELKCFSQNDAYNLEVLAPDTEDGLADLMITVVEPAKCVSPVEETNAEFIKNIAENSNHLTDDLISLDAAYFMRSSSLHFNHESKQNAEDVSFQVPLGKVPSIAENFEQNTPALCTVLDNLFDNEISKEAIESHNTFGSKKEKRITYSPIGVNFGMQEINKGEQMSENDNHSLPCTPKGVTGGILVDTIEAQRLNLSETILFQNFNNSVGLEMNSNRTPLLSVENYQSSHINYHADSRMLALYEVKTTEPEINLRNIPNLSGFEANWLTAAPKAFQNQDVDKNVTGTIDMPQPNSSPLCFNEDSKDAVNPFSLPGLCSLVQVEERLKEIPERSKAFAHSQLHPSCKSCSLTDNFFFSEKNFALQPTTNNDDKNPPNDVLYKRSLLDGSLAKRLSWNDGDMELVGCYLHPEPVLSIVLTENRNQLQLIVLCGFPDGNNRHIFMYAISAQKQRRGCPSFLGYTALVLPHVRNQWNRNIPFERSALQLTPDGQSLIFVNSIKVPRCREKNISCSCSNCLSESSKVTTLEIAHVNFGYVSTMAKLTTGEGISCMSVCEPNFLVAAEENRGLHIWVMNLTWSDFLEEFMLPTFDHISPTILELKGLPNYSSLLIGHNGLGDFGIWEISKRVLLAKFSSAGCTIFQIIPISLFNLQMNATFPATLSAEHIMESMLKPNYEISLGSSFEDVSIWILISTAPELETELEVKTSPAGLWRLALITKNMIIMGNILNPRATAVDASANCGIIGTSDGFLYKFELSSGRKLGNLSSIQCGVSCVALDNKSGALAVAGRDGKLQVFIEP